MFPGRYHWDSLLATRAGLSGQLVLSEFTAAALVKAKYPSYTGLQIGEVLKVTADPIDAVNANFIGKLGQGRLNVLRAITETAY